MNRGDSRALILSELGNIAPETDASQIDPHADLRDALDIDSLDFLNFVTALHKKTGINIPESDYTKLLTLHNAISYLESKIGS